MLLSLSWLSAQPKDNVLIMLQHLSPSQDSTEGGCEDVNGHDDVVPKESQAWIQVYIGTVQGFFISVFSFLFFFF
jgi:hypothetical protein